ncbi:MAG: hypothetical protein CVV27_01195 [Candidatus Melainabacteria bacterium HGW-Melainabacteria-1]|nr:MAG: hypothetical protein CVV27_01195 [Candidatus Melainabacteria bacterium HGW-Melainabacteria-1]
MRDNDAIVRQAFGAATAAKGFDYYRQRRATILGVKADQRELRVDAQVRGRRYQPYQLSLFVEPDYPEGMYGECSCPMATDCKHCAAAAYLWLKRPEAQADPEQLLKLWLQQLEPPIQNSPDELVLYCFALPNTSLGAHIRPVGQRRQANGEFGPPRQLSAEMLASPHNGFAAAERELGQLLLNARAEGAESGREAPLAGKAGRLALTELINSGNCRLDHPDGPALQLSDSRELGFRWHEGERGWRLLPDLGSGRLFWLDGPWYLDAASVGPLVSAIPQRQLGALLAAPPIPANRIDEVALQLFEKIPAAPLPEGMEVKIIDEAEPQPYLTLRSDTTAQGQGPGRTVHLAELAFVYDEVFVQPGATSAEVRIAQDGDLYVVHRDLAAEAQWREQLEPSGLQPLGDGIHFTLPGDSAQERASNWEHWLREGVPALEDQGWSVDPASDFSLEIYTGGDWDARVTAHEDNQWFDFSLGVDLDGQQVNLLPLIVTLLQQWPEPATLLQHLSEQEHVLLPLGNEQWLRAPAQRLGGIVSTLIELYEREALSDGKLEFSWYESLHLDALLNAEGLTWQGETAIRQLAEGLRNFAGLDPVPVPDRFDATLRPYQQQGLDWLQFLRSFGFHGILADDMGLGKTIQTLAHLLIEKQSGRAKGPSLVLAPTSVVGNWRREAERFAPDLKVLVLHGADRREDFAAIADYDLVISSYALIRLDQDAHLNQTYHLLILDEAQYIKNPRSKTAEAIFALNAVHRLALSGTPMENHLAELWSIFHFLMPGFLGSLSRFTRMFRTPIEKDGDKLRAEELRRRIRPFLLRRTKLQVERDLPAKTEIVQYVNLEGPQRDLYETVRVAMDARVKAEIGKKGLKRSQIMLLDALLKLRQTCCDPRLLPMDSAKKVKASAKMDFLSEQIPEMVEEGRRILIFSQFVKMLDLIEAELDRLEIPLVRLTGETRDRDAVVAQFQTGTVPVFLISLKAGGVGLNLTAADTVIHYDPWWNPAAENQATDRAWRIGQDKPVFVYKLIGENTVEEKILALQQKKLQLTSGMYTESEGEFRIDAEELLALLS